MRKFKYGLYSRNLKCFLIFTGYGDIVPITVNGKILTIVYALYGIPVFIWYIIKLGGLFRVMVMRLLRNIIDAILLVFYKCKNSIRRKQQQSPAPRRVSAI